MTKKKPSKPKKQRKSTKKSKKKNDVTIYCRPKTLLGDLPNDWESLMIQMYTDGATDVEVRCQLPVHGNVMSDDLWYRLIKDEPTFSRTVKRGKALAQAWWIGRGRLGMGQGKAFNAVPWIFCMKNMFGWQDKKVIELEKTKKYKVILEIGEGQRKVHDVLSGREKTD